MLVMFCLKFAKASHSRASTYKLHGSNVQWISFPDWQIISVAQKWIITTLELEQNERRIGERKQLAFWQANIQTMLFSLDSAGCSQTSGNMSSPDLSSRRLPQFYTTTEKKVHYSAITDDLSAL